MSFILCQSIGGHQLLTIVLLVLQSFFLQVICPTLFCRNIERPRLGKVSKDCLSFAACKKVREGMS